jgi:hypothetical protein
MRGNEGVGVSARIREPRIPRGNHLGREEDEGAHS